MKTPCAFHQGNYIIQFCKCIICLLPLCQQCLNIHRKQHLTISQPIQLIPIENIINQTSYIINNQFKYIDTIAIETINKFKENDQLHKKLFQEIITHKDNLIQSIFNIYDNILLELENNLRRRQIWIRQFNISVHQLKQELASLNNSLSEQKYLRTIIMWNRMKPYQIIQQTLKKAQKSWLAPSFIGCNIQKIIKITSENTNLKVLQIEGDSGINKILKIIKILRYGQDQNFIKNSKIDISSSTNIQQQNIIKNNKNNIVNLSSPSNKSVMNYNSSIIQTNIPFSPSNRKNSSKKIQVLSSLEQYKNHSQLLENR